MRGVGRRGTPGWQAESRALTLRESAQPRTDLMQPANYPQTPQT